MTKHVNPKTGWTGEMNGTTISTSPVDPKGNVKIQYNIASDEPVAARLDEAQLQFFLKRLVGKVLTVVDASIAEPTQRQAMKDLIVDQMWDTHWRLIDWMKGQSNGNSSTFPFRNY